MLDSHSNRNGVSQSDLRRRLEVMVGKGENQGCCDCNATMILSSCWASILAPPGPEAKNQSFGCFVCYACADSHKRTLLQQGLVSAVRSIGMDEWLEDQVVAIERGGNKKVNTVWEAKITFETGRPTPNSNNVEQRKERDLFVQSKYQDRLWYSATSMKKQASGGSGFGKFFLKASSSDTMSTRKPGSTLLSTSDHGESGDYVEDDHNNQPVGVPRVGRIASRRMSTRNISSEDLDLGYGPAVPDSNNPTASRPIRRTGRRASMAGSAAPITTTQAHLQQHPQQPRRRAARRSSLGVVDVDATSSRDVEPQQSRRPRRVRRGSMSVDVVPDDTIASSRSLLSSDDDDEDDEDDLKDASGDSKPIRRVRPHSRRNIARSYSSQSHSSDDASTMTDRSGGSGAGDGSITGVRTMKGRRLGAGIQRTRSSRLRAGNSNAEVAATATKEGAEDPSLQRRGSSRRLNRAPSARRLVATKSMESSATEITISTVDSEHVDGHKGMDVHGVNSEVKPASTRRLPRSGRRASIY